MDGALNTLGQDATIFASGLEVSGGARRAFTIDFLLVPGFDLLTLAASIEPLRRANTLQEGTSFIWRLVAWDKETVAAASEVHLRTIMFDPADKVADLTLVCADRDPEANIPDLMPDHLRLLWRRGHVVGALGAGVFALAQAGILAGHRFALHWEHVPLFSTLWPSLEPREETFCIDRRIVTTAGGFSAADLSLHHIEVQSGQAVSKSTMDLCLLPMRRSEGERQTSSVASRLGNRNPNLLKAVEWMEKNFLNAGDLDLYCAKIGVSQRQLQRLFKTHIGKTPTQYLAELRLDHARVLLLETDASVGEIAQSCGFESATHFSKRFRRTFGMSPFKFSHSKASHL